MNVNLNNRLIKAVLNNMQHYNHEKYWKMRKEVVNPKSRLPKLIRMYYLYRIKKSDAFNNASMGTDLGGGANFKTPPYLVHGLNGIVISHYAKIGCNCKIYQHVTIAQWGDKSAIIGDNCEIGAGAVILKGVTIGNNVKIGANCVVTKNIPDNCTVVGVPGKIILRD